MPTEETPLLWDQSRARKQDVGEDVHSQFCSLVGIPSTYAPDKDKRKVNPKSLYGRVTHQFSSQNRTYMFSASLSNTLLLSQVIIGAALTGLGASQSSPILVTIFGAMNTIIAGLVAYLKSRGQPMRSRMYRDDLERLVDEIENSEVMWLGISRGVHGYSDIDTDKEVTVRSEVARLTRLYDRAVRNNTMNNPDMYMAGGGPDMSNAGLRHRAVPGEIHVPTSITLPATSHVSGDGAEGTTGTGVATHVADPDQSPASAPPKPKEPPKQEEPPRKEEPANQGSKSAAAASDDSAPKPVQAGDEGRSFGSSQEKGKSPDADPSALQGQNSQPPADPDASPATVVRTRSRKENEAPKKVEGDDDA